MCAIGSCSVVACACLGEESSRASYPPLSRLPIEGSQVIRATFDMGPEPRLPDLYRCEWEVWPTEAFRRLVY